jgi:hypothetical protein
MRQLISKQVDLLHQCTPRLRSHYHRVSIGTKIKMANPNPIAEPRHVKGLMDLPIELRLVIWALATPGSRVIEADVPTLRKAQPVTFSREDAVSFFRMACEMMNGGRCAIGTTWTKPSSTQSEALPLLHVCWESRCSSHPQSLGYGKAVSRT